MSEPTIAALVVCDDVRREENGKYILLGVYSGDIIVSRMPFRLPLALWIEYVPVEEGAQTLMLRLAYSGGERKAPVSLSVDIRVTALATLGIAIPGLQMEGKEPGEFLIEYSIDKGATWQRGKQKNVRVGKVRSLARPTPSGPEPSNL